MGLFSGASSGKADQELLDLFIPSGGASRDIIKVLEKSSSTIRMALASGENLRAITRAGLAGLTPIIAVITNRRVFAIRKNSIAWSYDFEEIRDTKLFRTPAETFQVGVFKHSFYTNYDQNDSRRFRETENLEFPDRQSANAAILLIDSYLRSVVQMSPDDQIGTRYRSDLDIERTVLLWEAAVGAAYRGAQQARSVTWRVDPFPAGYRPYGGNEGIGGGLIPRRDPDISVAIDVGNPAGVVSLAAWREMVSMTMTRPIVELWCVTPDDRISTFDRQRLEQFWNDDSLSRLGFVERGLWGVHHSPPEVG